MAKFLTPPEWYDQNGNLNNMLNCPSGEKCVALMAGDDNNSNNSVSIGWNAGCHGGANSIAIGCNAKCRGGNNTIAIGANTLIESGHNNIAIGVGNSWGSNTIAIGAGAAFGDDSVFVGKNSGGGESGASISNSIAIGSGATVDADLQIQIGNNSSDYDVRFGKTKPMLVEYLGKEIKSFINLDNEITSEITFEGNSFADFATFDINISESGMGSCSYVIFSYGNKATSTPAWFGKPNKIKMITISRNSNTGKYTGTSFGSSLTIDSGGISLTGWLKEASAAASVTAHYYKGVK